MTRGFTLLEMMVTLAILGLLTAVTGLAVRSLRPSPQQHLLQELAAAREEAIRSGRSVVWHLDSNTVRFLPNGSSSGGRVTAGAGTVAVDPLTGGIRDPR